VTLIYEVGGKLILCENNIWQITWTGYTPTNLLETVSNLNIQTFYVGGVSVDIKVLQHHKEDWHNHVLYDGTHAWRIADWTTTAISIERLV